MCLGLVASEKYIATKYMKTTTSISDSMMSLRNFPSPEDPLIYVHIVKYLPRNFKYEKFIPASSPFINTTAF